MSQNFPAYTAQQPDGTLTFVPLDARGAVNVSANGENYETVAASQTAQVLGGTGAVGDILTSLLIVPSTTSPGTIQIKDGSNTAITVFTGGANSVGDLKPYLMTFNIASVAGAWQVTTGANVSVLATGQFS